MPDAAGVDERPVDDDAPGEARDDVPRREPVEDGVDVGQRVAPRSRSISGDGTERDPRQWPGTSPDTKTLEGTGDH